MTIEELYIWAKENGYENSAMKSCEMTETITCST